jgi:long-chain acyl-CoA synthetase
MGYTGRYDRRITVNYCELLYNTEEKYLDNEVLIDTENGRRVTYGGLEEEVQKVAAFLKAKGFGPGDTISTHIYNSAEAAIVLLAIQYIGGVICLIDPLFKAGELNYYIKDSDSKGLITYIDKEDIQFESDIDAEIINVKEIEEVCRLPLASFDIENDFYDYKEDELAMLLYTSGSTSRPKGVMLTTKCFFTFLAKSDESMYKYNPEDRLLCFVPFSHGYGAISLLIPALDGKAAIVFMRAFQPIKIGKLISSEKITHIFGVPTHYQQLLRYESLFPEFRKLKKAFSAAAPLSYETAYSWYKNTGVYLDEGLGLTECSTLVTTRLSMLPEPTGNVGFPPKSVFKVEVADAEGKACDEGIIGEIRVKGPGLMLGYYKRPKETAERLKDGWLYTGDVGYIRSDGSLVISGRITEFINVAGLKITPIEIEAVLNSHPDVLDSAAVGVEDHIYGEIIKAFVVLKDNRKVEERDLIRYVSSKLANFKVPKYIEFLDEFPRNNLGKIDKKALKNR